MNHSYIEEHNIADRYLLGKLSAEERQLFEAHIQSCRQCIDQLQTIADFRTGLRIVASEELWQARARAEAGFLSRILRPGRAGQVALLVIAFLLIALPSGLLILKGNDAHRDLNRVRETDSEYRRKNGRAGENAPEVAKEAETANRQSGAARDRLAHRTKSVGRSSPSSVEEKPHRSSVPVFTLNANRGSDLSQPVNRIEFSPADKSIIFLLDLGSDQDLESYRAAISAADGVDILRESQLTASSNGMLALNLGSNLFKPGNYLLTLEGLNRQNRYVLIARYSLSIVIR